jgi:NAD(P)-dependent dehydrogenase (short-subunit alcohol dehydrogenase family)
MNVIITGASRGIGLELTRQTLSKGDQVLAVARQPKNSPGLGELLKKYPQKLQVLTADMTDPEVTEKILSAAKAWTHVDILINNAGIFREGKNPEDFQASFHTNAVAPFLVSQALLPQLKKSAHGRVVQITSQMGSIADNSSGGYSAYRASKAALNMLNKCLTVENPWLTAIVIHPGWVKTDMGGKSAPVEPVDSAAGIWKVIHELRHEDSGNFFNFRGETLPW